MAVDDLQLEFAAGIAATSEQMRKAGEMMLESAKIASQYAQALCPGGIPASKLKAIASSAGEAEPVTNGKRKRIVKKKDPNAPKRPASSYLMFQNDIRKELKEKFPNLSHTELIDLIKTQWKDMPEAKRQKYSDQVVRDKERYAAEKSARSHVPNAKVEAEAALKKPRQRKSKAEKVVTPAVVAPATDEEAPRTSEGEEDDDEEDEDEEEEEERKPQRSAAPARASTTSEDEDEEDEDEEEEEEEEPAPKKLKVASKPVPVSKSKPAPVKEKKKSSKA
ncbi:hypothetical protein FB45DRAFT_902678 [Roridomyces roridus]|uniref:HMG box domain-containing protein n=1 Tax=Roridomyces roridus TaxID=1738132 RepID=A0AAD7FQW9_9AGAR|nr:hypothetical protein FB45DRAFT_902678 [Roridomyces roridus]